MPNAVKLSDELIAVARRESKIASRSMAQQIEHWARIGRVAERTGALDPLRVRTALAADLAFDELTSAERTVVFEELAATVFRPEGDAELRSRLLASGRSLSELDARGRVVRRRPAAPARRRRRG